MVIYDELTASEKEAIEELKSRLDKELTPALRNDESLYLRFLRARDFKVNLAEDMLRKHIAWRKNMRIDTLAEDFTLNQVILDYMPLTRIGFDKEGAPIRFFDFGPFDCKGLLKAAKKNHVIKTIISFFEDDVRLMKEQSKKLGKPLIQWTYLFDFHDYTFAQATHKATIEFLLSLFQIYEANYPERLKIAFVVNTSFYFSLIFSVVKPMLSGATTRKINIYGKDGWKSDLLKYIDADVLPVHMGGTRTDTIQLGKEVPEELYLVNSRSSISSHPDTKKFVVSRMAKIQFPVKVEESGSLLDWEFETQTRDIEFGLFYKTDGGKLEELIPLQRIDASLSSETGLYLCHRPGMYVLVFDNSYSWIHQKEIYCKVSVTPFKK